MCRCSHVIAPLEAAFLTRSAEACEQSFKPPWQGLLSHDMVSHLAAPVLSYALLKGGNVQLLPLTGFATWLDYGHEPPLGLFCRASTPSSRGLEPIRKPCNREPYRNPKS